MVQNGSGLQVQYFICRCCVLILTTSLMYNLIHASTEDLDPIVVPRSYKDFVGNRKDNKLYFIGKRTGHKRYKMACDSFLECPSNHCCAYGDDVKQISLLFPLIKPKAFCQPMGSVGDLCFSSQSQQDLPFGCGCSTGNACVTFIGQPYGVCMEDKK